MINFSISSNSPNVDVQKSIEQLRDFSCNLCAYSLYPATGKCTNPECANYHRAQGAMSIEKFVRVFAQPPLFHGRRWGAWTFDVERWVLVFEAEPVTRGGEDTGCPAYEAFIGHYEIDLERITRSSNLLDWIFQINGKVWATQRVMKDLLNALDDIIHPQANLCSFGSDRVIKSPTKFLKARLAGERRAA